MRMRAHVDADLEGRRYNAWAVLVSCDGRL
jgi:hypothetical protein